MKRKALGILLVILMVASVFVLASCEDLFGLDHQHEYTTDVTPPTCTSQGYTTYTCSCGDTYKDNYVDKTDHTYGAWQIIKNSTCTENGEESRTCNNCSAIETREITKSNHDYSSVTVTSPTCTEQGYTTYTCTCGDFYVDNHLPANGHTQSDWIIDTKATCVANGTRHTECSLCGTILESEIILSYHEYEDDNCTICGVTHEKYFSFAYLDDTDSYSIKPTSSNNIPSSIVLPEVYMGKAVTTINSSAFCDCQNLISIIIPDSIEFIGFGAFDGCSSLESITLPFVGESKKTPEDTHQYPFGYIFGTMSYRNSIRVQQYYTVYPGSYNETDYYYIPTTLKNVTIGGEYIPRNAFENCTMITDIVIRDSITSIGSGAFYHCENLNNIALPDSIKYIYVQAFEGTAYYDDKSNWLDGVLYIGNHLISVDQTTSGELVIKDGTITIAENGLSGCVNLTSVTIPDSVISIGLYAFSSSNCQKIEVDKNNPKYHSINNCIIETATNTLIIGLENCTIPDYVTSIADYAFNVYDGLLHIIIPENVSYISSTAFEICENIETIEVSSKNSFYHSKNNCLIETTTNTLVLGCNNSVIPDYITAIGDRAFICCYFLSNVNLPQGLQTIGDWTFSGCYNITNITLPDSLVSIGDGAFQHCSISTITIPANIKQIGDWAFYCTNLKDFYITDVDAWVSIEFKDYGTYLSYGGAIMHIIDENGSELTDITISKDVNVIPDNAFCNAKNIVKVTLPSSITTIGSSAFSGCTSLTNVVIPDSVTSIGNSAFSGCESLKSVTIPDSVTSIGSWAFYDCDSLESVVIGDSVTSIGNTAFSSCYSLGEVYYNGSAAEWNSISIGYSNDPLKNATRYYYSESHPIEEGNFWHWVDGEPTVWQ